MRKRTLERLKTLLEQRRAELTEQYSKELRRSRDMKEDGAEDYADVAFSSYTKEFLLSLSDMDRGELILVEEAIRRLETDEFGVCQECDENIAEKRLLAVPWARYCIQCKELEEKGMLPSTLESALERGPSLEED